MLFRALTLSKALPYILIVAGTVGLLCAGIIMYEKVQLLENPAYIPSCNLNPTVSCGSVMQSDQANAFGFPNPFIGLAAFPIVITIGAALLAGAAFKRWFWLGLHAGTIFGLGFVHWLFFQSVYRINALCPWCIVVWIATITIFWYVTLHILDKGYLKLPTGKLQTITGYARRHHLDILITWFIVLAAFILNHFWYYYGQYFPF